MENKHVPVKIRCLATLDLIVCQAPGTLSLALAKPRYNWACQFIKPQAC